MKTPDMACLLAVGVKFPDLVGSGWKYNILLSRNNSLREITIPT